MPYILNTQHLDLKIKKAPIAGPTMIAVCIPVELKATAFCKIFRGTSDGVKDC